MVAVLFAALCCGSAQEAGGMVPVPGKPCWIGEEKSLRQVTLPAFLMDSFPVTNEAYSAYVVATGAAPPGHWTGQKIPKGRERHPVVMVIWEQAAAYAKWAGKRLPTAEEWEVAARGDDKREYPWGNVFQGQDESFNCNSLEFWQVHKSRAPGTTPLEEFAARSPFGAAMGGNVWEWTSTTAAGRIGDKEAEFRILKGGSFMTSARAIRCAVALPENPVLRHHDVGFRCAKDLR